MPFQIKALCADDFAHYFDMTDAELAAHNACRQVVTTSPGSPSRVSMQDAKVGETVILCNYTHQPQTSPYQAAHAIFVRQNATQAQIAVGTVPEVIRRRLISLRYFDPAHMMMDADVVAGDEVDAALYAAFADPGVAYVHIHNAKPGCFAASAHRVNASGDVQSGGQA